MTLTPETLAALRAGYVPGDALPGLLAGWIGPCEWEWAPGKWHPRTHDDGLPKRGRRRLPLARPECRARVVRVMAAGLKCLDCGGTATRLGGCPTCHGTGYLRPPTPLHPFLPTLEGGTIAREDWSAELIACSVGRVMVGLPAVRGVLDKPNIYGERKVVIGEYLHFAVRRPYHGLGGAALSEARRRDRARPRPWTWRVGEMSGEGTEAECWAAADAAALTAGFALLNADTLTAPWPEATHAR